MKKKRKRVKEKKNSTLVATTKTVIQNAPNYPDKPRP